jgi:hypothetical protein
MREVPHTVAPPAADFMGDGFVGTESRTSVIGLNDARVSLLRLAAENGLRVVLVTDGLCALTPAFAEVWREAGAAWVVRGERGLREGFSGRRLGDIADVLAAAPSPSIDMLDPGFLRPPAVTAVQVLALVSLRHRAQASTVLGGPASRLAELLTERPLSVWGAREPAGNQWDRTELTTFARHQMPGPIVMVGSGPGSRATITTQRTDHGVEEVTQLHANLGSPERAPLNSARQRILTYLGELAASTMPLVGMVMARPGPSDLLVRPQASWPTTPLALLIGPPAVRLLKLDISALISRFGARAVGRPQIPGLLFDLATSDTDPASRLDEVVAALGSDELDEVLGLTLEPFAAAVPPKPSFAGR